MLLTPTFQDGLLSNFLRTSKAPRNKILQLSIVLTLLIIDYVTWKNYFTSLGLINETQGWPKQHFKIILVLNRLKIANTTYLYKDIDYKEGAARFRL